MPLDLMRQIRDRLTGKSVEKEAPERLTMRVCMLGARGVGKTSVITSLYRSQKEAVSGTNLFLSADAATSTRLNNKENLLENLFKGLHAKGDLMTESGIPGDSVETVFGFTYGMHSERINIDLEIRDYPGEFLVQEPEKVANYVAEADAVLIAIDTPCLMEADGYYNEGKNRPNLVMDFLMKNLDSSSEKLVMFVPLKCEKYYLDETILQVTEKVRSVYSRLISHLKGQQNDKSGKKNVCCVITPIQTLGGVAFDSFETDDDGKVKEITVSGGLPVPSKVNYRYIATNAEYTPKNCEQPLYYLLAFVSRQYKQAIEQQNSSGFFARLRELFRLTPKIDEFMLEIALLGQRRLDGSEGCKVLFGKGRIGG